MPLWLIWTFLKLISTYGIFLGLIFFYEQVMKRQLKVVKNTPKSHRQTPPFLRWGGYLLWLYRVTSNPRGRFFQTLWSSLNILTLEPDPLKPWPSLYWSNSKANFRDKQINYDKKYDKKTEQERTCVSLEDP